MSIGEICWRTRQSFQNGLSVFFRSARISPTLVDEVNLQPWKAPQRVETHKFVRAAERVLAGEAELFGNWVSVCDTELDWNRDPVSGVQAPLLVGSRLDYRDSNLVGSARNIWEVNRHFQLVMLAQAWSLTGDDRYRQAGKGMLADWIAACPYPKGINWISALEHGIRLINWYIAARIFEFSSSEMTEIRGWLTSIYQHCHFVWRRRSRYSSANNHLIGEMAGLYIASVAWPCWQESSNWRQRSKQTLEDQALHQVYPDGVLKEQSTGYQVFVIQLLLIAGLVGEAAGDTYSAQYWQSIKRMICFLASIKDAGGSVPNIGDADEGVAFLLHPEARFKRLDDMLDLARLWSNTDGTNQTEENESTLWLSSGFPRPSHWPAGPIARLSAFPDGGYYVIGDNLGTSKEVILVFDTGELGYLSICAHGHADCLSFTLSIAGERILIDPGTYSYHDNPVWRDYFRGTRAHNTVVVDDKDQSEIGGPFMWLTKARPTIEEFEIIDDKQRIKASHDGYTRLDDPVTHCRELTYYADLNELVVVDEIEAIRPHLIRRFWHFGPGCKLRKVSEDQVEVLTSKVRMHCKLHSDSRLEIFEGSTEPRAGWISPRFGEIMATPTLRITNNLNGSAKLRMTINWRFLEEG